MPAIVVWLLLAILAISVGASPAHRKLSPRSMSLGLERNPEYARDGPGQYLRALKKWDVEIPDGFSNLTSIRGDVGDITASSFNHDREFLSRVGFGTPFQYMNVDLDTGSADVWVYTSETKAVDSGDRAVWVIENSTTAKRVPGADWKIEYGDESTANGNVYIDNIDVGGFTIKDAVVESAVEVSPLLTSDPYLGGIFGLAYGHRSQVSPRQPAVWRTMMQQLDKQVFTTDFKWHGDDGAFTFGYIDENRHIDEIKYTPLKPGAIFWSFNFTGIHIVGQNLWYLSQWEVIADTGTSLMLLSPDVVNTYYSAVLAARLEDSTWVFPCNSPPLPDFEIGLANGWVGRVPGRYINYTSLQDDPKTCMGGLQPIDHPFGILGAVFLKSVYAVYDVAGSRIGFAHKNLDI